MPGELPVRQRGDGAQEGGRQGQGGELPAQQGGTKNLSMRGEGRPLSPAGILAPNYDGGDGKRLANSPHGSEEMAPRKMGAKDRE